MTERLIEGFYAFRKKEYESGAASMPKLVEDGQDPEYFIISCIDSRTNPGTIFQSRPGTFFAHKSMGAIVRPYKKGTALSAALQFALHYLHVKKIIILGHTGCGAVKALVENLQDEEIASFVAVAQKSLQRAKQKKACKQHHDNLFRHAEEEIIIMSRENLLTYPSVQKALREGKTEIKCWLFEMEGGNLLEYDEKVQSFVPMSPLKTVLP